MSERLRGSIAEAFRQEETAYPVPAGLRDQVVDSVMDRRPSSSGTPRLLALVAVLLAVAVIATLITLRRLPGEPAPAASPTPPRTTPAASAAPTPAARFTAARFQQSVATGPYGESLAFTETGLQPGQSVSYHTTGNARLLYDCSQGARNGGGQAYPSVGAVDFGFTRTADAQGQVSDVIAIPPPVPVPPCTPAGRLPLITGDWLNFVIEDTTSGVRSTGLGVSVAT